MSDDTEDIVAALEEFEEDYGVHLTDEEFDQLGRYVAADADQTGEIDVAGVVDALDYEQDDLAEEVAQLREDFEELGYEQGDPEAQEEEEFDAAVQLLEQDKGRPLTGTETEQLWNETPWGSDRDDYRERFRGPSSREVATDDTARVQYSADVIRDADAEQREEAWERGEEIPEETRYFTTETEQALTEALETPEETDG